MSLCCLRPLHLRLFRILQILIQCPPIPLMWFHCIPPMLGRFLMVLTLFFPLLLLRCPLLCRQSPTLYLRLNPLNPSPLPPPNKPWRPPRLRLIMVVPQPRLYVTNMPALILIVHLHVTIRVFCNAIFLSIREKGIGSVAIQAANTPRSKNSTWSVIIGFMKRHSFMPVSTMVVIWHSVICMPSTIMYWPTSKWILTNVLILIVPLKLEIMMKWLNIWVNISLYVNQILDFQYYINWSMLLFYSLFSNVINLYVYVKFLLDCPFILWNVNGVLCQ